MSLVTGRGPLSKDPAGWFTPPLPDDVVFVEPHPRRIQAIARWRTGDRHRAGPPGAPRRSSAQLRVSRRRGRRSSARPRRRRRRAMCTCRGMPSTRGSRRGASSSTIRRTRTTGSTAARRTAGCGSSSPGTTLVDTTDTMVVFETALAPLLYVDPVACADRPAAALGHDAATATTRATRRTGRP